MDWPATALWQVQESLGFSRVECQTSSGYDKNPYWNKEYLPLIENKRDTDRSESYDILFSDSTKKLVNYDVWKSTELNDGIIATRCRLGIIYKIETVSQ